MLKWSGSAERSEFRRCCRLSSAPQRNRRLKFAHREMHTRHRITYLCVAATKVNRGNNTNGN